jgi:hypothetical protein
LPWVRALECAREESLGGIQGKTTHNEAKGGSRMKVNRRFWAAGLCILLSSLVFVFLANVGPASGSDTETTEMHEEGAVHETSDAWAAESEEEYKEGEGQEQFREEVSEEGEEGVGYQDAPSDEEDEPISEESSDEESMHMNAHEEDDLAHAPRADE